MLVGLARVELATNGLGNRCSIHLSYSPVTDSLLQQKTARLTVHGCTQIFTQLARFTPNFVYTSRQPAGLTSSMSAKKPSASVGWI